jgi:GNAT superfamily N-acetyltransferase
MESRALTTISLSAAAEAERVTLENLMQLYIYDWSELRPLDVGGDGRFEADALDSYFEYDWRHPLLLRVDGRLAGFALVSRRSRLTGAAGVFDMAEFFVMRRYRRKGVGLAAAAAAFDRFKGRGRSGSRTRTSSPPRSGGAPSIATRVGAIARCAGTMARGSGRSRCSRADSTPRIEQHQQG